MVTELFPSRLALRANHDHQDLEGAWWPQSRRLADQLATLFELWPPSAGHISRVLYSPPDWDDHPHAAPVQGRYVKTGCFPGDDTHTLVLSMSDGERKTLRVIAPETPRDQALKLLAECGQPVERESTTGV